MSEQLITSITELPHFPFGNFSQFKAEIASQAIRLKLRQDGALQLAAGSLVAQPPADVALTYRVCRLLGGAFPSAIFLALYSIITAHYWLLLAVPLCWLAAFLFDPLMSRVIGPLHWLPLIGCFCLFGWALFTGQQMWLAATSALLLIWLALKIRLMATVPAFYREVLANESVLCMAWLAGWLVIIDPKKRAEYNIFYENSDGQSKPTAYMAEKLRADAEARVNSASQLNPEEVFGMSQAEIDALGQSWTVFSPPAGQFRILMPGSVETKIQEMGESRVEIFRSQGEEHNYFVYAARLGSELTLDAYIGGIQLGATPDGAKGSILCDVKGDGWTGKVCRLCTNGVESKSVLIARVAGTDVVYNVTVDAPFADPNAVIFLKSFAAFPEKVLP